MVVQAMMVLLKSQKPDGDKSGDTDDGQKETTSQDVGGKGDSRSEGSAKGSK